MKMLLYATGMAPARVFPQPGGDFALTGRKGRLRACMKDVQCFFSASYFLRS
ncbi:replication protein RepA4 [Salmonella enterica]|nr:replication protein RepA4 [Salmonella enterica]